MHVDTITAPILILHGAQDERVPVRQAEAFAETLREKQKAVTVKIFPYAKHGIPREDQDREIDPFLDSFLRYGIGASRPKPKYALVLAAPVS